MKSQIIQQMKKDCEIKQKISFCSFTFKDVDTYVPSLACYESLEPAFHNGIKLIFTHRISLKETFKFMTIVWTSDFVEHPDLNIKQLLKTIVGKKIRLYKEIFELPYFDFSDVIWPSNLIKVKNS